MKFHEENMQFDYPNWSTIHHNHWQVIFDKYLTQPTLQMLEIGCFEGRSTMWFADKMGLSHDSTLHCVDNWKGGEEVVRSKLNFDMGVVRDNFYKNITTHQYATQIVAHEQDSEFFLCTKMPHFYRFFNFIYLDGSHTQKDTLVDMNLCMSMLNKKGVLIVDDYLNLMNTNDPLLRPRDAVNFIVKSFGNEIEFFTTPEKQAVIIRK